MSILNAPANMTGTTGGMQYSTSYFFSKIILKYQCQANKKVSNVSFRKEIEHMIPAHLSYVKAFVFSVLTFFLTSLSSCSGKQKKNEAIYQALTASLEASTKTIKMYTERTHYSMSQKAADPTTNYKAEIWKPKADKISELTTRMNNYLNKLKEEADSNNISLPSKTIDALFDSLETYKYQLLSVDSIVYKEFRQDLLSNSHVTSLQISKNEFEKRFFNHKSPILKKLLLTKLENDINITENKLVLFCSEMIPSSDRYYDSYSVIIGQNLKTLSPGEQLEISAGVGAFSLVAKPEIVINGKTVLLNDQGLANFKLKAPTRLGSHLIPVIISFIDPEGKRVKREFSVEYSVREKCN